MFIYFKIIMWDYRTLEMKYLHHPALEEKTTCWTAVQIFFDVYTVLHIELWIIYLNGKYDCSKQTCVYMYIYTYVYVCVYMCMYMLESINRPLRTHICGGPFFSAPDSTKLHWCKWRKPLVCRTHSLSSDGAGCFCLSAKLPAPS